MRILYIVPAQRTIQSTNNNMSLIDILEQLSVDSGEVGLLKKDDKVAIPLQITIASLILKEDGDPDEFRWSLVIRGPEGQEFPASFDLAFDGKPRKRVNLTMPNFPYWGVGNYELELQVENNKGSARHSYPITIDAKNMSDTD